MVFGLFKKEKPDLEKDLKDPLGNDRASMFELTQGGMKTLIKNFASFNAANNKKPLKECNVEEYFNKSGLLYADTLHKQTFERMVKRYGKEVVEDKLLNESNILILKNIELNKHLKTAKKDALKELNLWLKEEQKKNHPKKFEPYILELFDLYSKEINESSFSDFYDWYCIQLNPDSKNYFDQSERIGRVLNEIIIEVNQKDDIVAFLKKEKTKLPASDIDFQLRIGDVDLVKELCEELYRDKKIGRTGNYRYFV